MEAIGLITFAPPLYSTNDLRQALRDQHGHEGGEPFASRGMDGVPAAQLVAGAIPSMTVPLACLRQAGEGEQIK